MSFTCANRLALAILKHLVTRRPSGVVNSGSLPISSLRGLDRRIEDVEDQPSGVGEMPSHACQARELVVHRK
jgi:hypothetical protein